ncbi:MAG: hypothetical protein DME25_16550, partial [Verrucomicrobia bacterium]
PDYPKVSRALTVAGWVNDTDGLWGPIVNNWVLGRPIGSSGQFFVEVDLDGGVPTLRASIEVGPNKVLASSAIDGSVNAWHHFALSANGVTMSIYWDGQLVSSVDYLGSINSTLFPWLEIGARLNAAPGDPNPQPDLTQMPPYFVGGMDDLALWNRGLSAIEIEGIYTGGLAGKSVSQIPPVLNINHSPLANDDSATTPAGTAVTINVLANDTDPDNDTLTISSVTAPANGTAVITTNNTVIYTPRSGFSGSDSFGYRIGDGHGGIGSATVQVTVGPSANHCPTTSPLAVGVGQNGSVNFRLVASDADGDPLTYTVTTAPAHGTVVVQVQTGAASYSPTQGFCGTDSFSFKVNDGKCDSAQSVVTVTVTNCNRCPIANPLTVTVEVGGHVDFHLPASDPDGDPLTYSITGPPAHGIVVVQVQTGAASYSPNAGYSGPDSFKYKANDGHCGDSGEATVSINVVVGGNHPPVAVLTATSTNVISFNGSNAVVHLNGTLSSDPDNDPLTFATFLDAGTVPVAHTATVDLVLDLGDHTIMLLVDDGHGGTATATVIVHVITAGEAVDDLVQQVDQANLERRNKRPLIASLKVGTASFDRGNFESGANQLRASQNKIRAQVAPVDAALASSLIAAAVAAAASPRRLLFLAEERLHGKVSASFASLRFHSVPFLPPGDPTRCQRADFISKRGKEPGGATDTGTRRLNAICRAPSRS